MRSCCARLRLAHEPAPGRTPIPTLVGDLGRRLLDTLDFGDRSVVLALIVGAVLLLILLVDESDHLRQPADDAPRSRLSSLAVPLTAAVALLILQRVFTIVL